MHVDVFYNTGCPSCERVKQDVLIPLEQQEKITITWRNVDEPEHYFPLLEAQAKFNKTYHSPTVVGPDFMLTGETEIRELDLPKGHFARLRGNDTTGNTLATPALTFGTVTAAGLVDSINPCALATIIFFIAYLRIRRFSIRKMILAGCAFCLGVFLTYLAMGWGLLNLLYQFEILFEIRYWLNLMMAVICFILGGLSLYDAWRSRHSKSRQLILQLPDWAKRFIHSKIRKNVNQSESDHSRSETQNFASHRNVLISGVILGFLIALVEGICTGQVYLPTLVYLTKVQQDITAFFWLIWYNVLFIVPLLVLLALVFVGVSQTRIESWFRRHIVWSKVLLSAFFFGLGWVLLQV